MAPEERMSAIRKCCCHQCPKSHTCVLFSAGLQCIVNVGLLIHTIIICTTSTKLESDNLSTFEKNSDSYESRISFPKIITVRVVLAILSIGFVGLFVLGSMEKKARLVYWWYGWAIFVFGLMAFISIKHTYILPLKYVSIKAVVLVIGFLVVTCRLVQIVKEKVQSAADELQMIQMMAIQNAPPPCVQELEEEIREEQPLHLVCFDHLRPQRRLVSSASESCLESIESRPVGVRTAVETDARNGRRGIATKSIPNDLRKLGLVTPESSSSSYGTQSPASRPTSGRQSVHIEDVRVEVHAPIGRKESSSPGPVADPDSRKEQDS